LICCQALWNSTKQGRTLWNWHILWYSRR